MRVFRAAALSPSRWPNGAGRKADIVAGDGWLIGLAWLDADAPFSLLPGLDRTITLVEGPGFVLDVDGVKLPVDVPFRPARFDGGATTTCRIVGPCRVLNAMTDRRRFAHAVTISPRPGLIDPGGDVACVVVALAGAVRAGEAVLGPLDAARLDAPTEICLSPEGRFARIGIRNAR